MIEPICWMPSRKAGQNIIEIKPRRNYGQEFEEILAKEKAKIECTKNIAERKNPRASQDPR